MAGKALSSWKPLLSLRHCRWSSSSTSAAPSASQFTLNPALDRETKRAQKTQASRQKYEQDKVMEDRAKGLEKNQTRNWKAGDVYSPRDLGPSEMRKWRKKKSPAKDAFDALGLDPLKQYKNFAIVSEYITEMGRIKPRSETGLRPVNQRKIAKAIRRAKGLGLMPGIYRHPEILLLERQQ